MEKNERIREVLSRYRLPGELLECVPFGSGHINGTYRLTFRETCGERRYILQTINRQVFTEPEKVMENICGVTAWLKKKIQEYGGNPERETLNIVPTADGALCCRDAAGEYWRIYLFIENAVSFDRVRDENEFYQSALAFGNFQRLLSDYPAHTLHETIRNFHNTPERYRQFQEALKADICSRGSKVEEEIRFVREREAFAHVLQDLQKSGRLPLRVTHNDTKLNNLMFDAATGKALCVIDLDTVMPGLSVMDFGDSIRYGANTAAEDERDLSRVSCDLRLYEAYVRGFTEGCAGTLTDLELEMLPVGAVMITFENGMRFLTDYLEGDHYYKIHRAEQNLDRARTQFKMVKDMEEKLPQMRAIAEKYRK